MTAPFPNYGEFRGDWRDLIGAAKGGRVELVGIVEVAGIYLVIRAEGLVALYFVCFGFLGIKRVDSPLLNEIFDTGGSSSRKELTMNMLCHSFARPTPTAVKAFPSGTTPTQRTVSLVPQPQQAVEAATPVDRWGSMMAKAQQGDKRAYNILLEELHAWLRRYYSRRLSRDHVEDAVQDALLAVHDKRHSYMPSRPFGPWISAIARYKWIDIIRESSRFKMTTLQNDLAVSDHGSAITSSIIVHDLLETLKPSQADAIRMVKLEGETVEVAARQIGQSEALIKVNVHRGIKKLATMVA